jgi:hypothetical protein
MLAECWSIASDQAHIEKTAISETKVCYYE